MDAALKVNVHGLLAATQYCCPKMEACGEGFVCVTGATASLRGLPTFETWLVSAAAAHVMRIAFCRHTRRTNGATPQHAMHFFHGSVFLS
jgi:NADP-dependent 3-hydroxy acid dehydrogenase YdfG